MTLEQASSVANIVKVAAEVWSIIFDCKARAKEQERRLAELEAEVARLKAAT